MESQILTTTIDDNYKSFYHSIISMEMYNTKVPISCGVDLFDTSSYYDNSLLVFGMIPHRTFPVIDYNQATEKIKGEFVKFQQNKKFKPINVSDASVSMEQAVVNALNHLYDDQMDTYAFIFSNFKDVVKEKHMYIFYYVDDSSIVRDFTVEEDTLPYIAIYTTINKKHAKSALKQFRKAWGRNKVIMCKTKISKCLDITEKL